MGEGGPVAIAHRGGADEAPENTLPAFEAAVALGYRYLETDAHVTRDGVLVAFHDARLDRVSDRCGAIAELSIDEVEAADAERAFTPDGGRTFPFRARGIRSRCRGSSSCWPAGRKHVSTSTPRATRASRRSSCSSAGWLPGSAYASAPSPTGGLRAYGR